MGLIPTPSLNALSIYDGIAEMFLGLPKTSQNRSLMNLMSSSSIYCMNSSIEQFIFASVDVNVFRLKKVNAPIRADWFLPE